MKWELGAVKGGKVKRKMTINHLKIICPKVLATLIHLC